jgi:hypothetical protein
VTVVSGSRNFRGRMVLGYEAKAAFFLKKTRKTPRAVIDWCKKRLKENDDTVRKAAKGSAQEPPKKGKG